MPKPIKKRVTKKTADTETEVKDRLITLKDTLKAPAEDSTKICCRYPCMFWQS